MQNSVLGNFDAALPNYPVVALQLGGREPLLGIQADACTDERCSWLNIVRFENVVIIPGQRLFDGNATQVLSAV